MASQQPNAWQTANRSRNSNSNSASRTPQTRSGTQSPSQQANPSQAPRQPPSSSVWTNRSSGASASNGQAKTEGTTQADETYQSVNGFNAAEVRAFLGRDGAAVSRYKPAEEGGAAGRSDGGSSVSSNMANNQPFFVQLAKQIATIEGGG